MNGDAAILAFLLECALLGIRLGGKIVYSLRQLGNECLGRSFRRKAI
jgi:hypothetical protein